MNNSFPNFWVSRLCRTSYKSTIFKSLHNIIFHSSLIVVFLIGKIVQFRIKIFKNIVIDKLFDKKSSKMLPRGYIDEPRP